MPILQAEERRSTKLNFRLPVTVKEKVERAAIASGLSVTDFAINSLLHSANEVLERQHTRTLSDRACAAFVELLDSQEPNDALRKAAEEYKRYTAE